MRNIALVFLLFVCSRQALIAQLEKGDALINFYTSYSQSKNHYFLDTYTSKSIFISPSIGYMVNNKLMIGGGVTYRHSKGKYSQGIPNIATELRATPFFRYYFLRKNKFNYFLFSEAAIIHSQHKSDSPNGATAKFFTASVQGGFGLSYLLTQNLAVETSIGTSLYQNKYTATFDDILKINIGLQLFLNDTKKWPKDLMNEYLQRGNYSLSGSGLLFIDDNPGFEMEGDIKIKAKETYHQYYLSPYLKYFISNYSAFIVNPLITGYGVGNSSQQTLEANTGAERYFPISKRIFVVPSMTFGIGRNSSKYYFSTFAPSTSIGGVLSRDTIKQKQVEYYLVGHFTLAARYFTKKASIWSIGIDHTRSSTDSYGSNNIWNFYAEHEHFLCKNISLAFKMDYNRIGLLRLYDSNVFVDGVDRRTLNYSLRLNYFIFNKKY